jgi:hypothetical protein
MPEHDPEFDVEAAPSDSEDHPADEEPPIQDSDPIEAPHPIAALPFETQPADPDSPYPAIEEASLADVDHAETEPLLFQYWSEPEVIPPPRIPHFGHLAVLALLILLAGATSLLVSLAAVQIHLFGVANVQQAGADIHYTLGSQALLYLLAFAGCHFVFPVFWQKGFFAGLQWNAAAALRNGWRLVGAAAVCFVLAIIDEVALPGPPDTPIDKLFQTRLAAWLLLVFGVTFAPFFEETLYRGFLLPAFCTAWDWATERATHLPARPLDENGHPQWSLPAMVAASIVTSIPFALMHAEQTGYSLGPFLLLTSVSLVLCWVRLSTRSLAASVFVHASYNLLLFSIMLVGTNGFQHLDKM